MNEPVVGRSHLVMRQPSSREDGNLLPSGNAVHAVDGRDTGLNHLLGVDTALRINGLTCDRTQTRSDFRRCLVFFFKKRNQLCCPKALSVPEAPYFPSMCSCS